jgi:hypothetical protein
MLSVIMLNVTNKPFMLSVVRLNVIMLKVMAPAKYDTLNDYFQKGDDSVLLKSQLNIQQYWLH